MPDNTPDELRKAFLAALGQAEKDTTYEGLLGGAKGQLHVINANGKRKTGYVWCRVLMPTGVSIREVRCQKISPTYNAPVMLREAIDGKMEVIGVSPYRAEQYYGDKGIPVSSHAFQHSLYGADPLRIIPLQYEPLLTHIEDLTALRVNVAPIFYEDYQGRMKYYAGGTVDLTAFSPSSSTQESLVYIAINPDTNQAYGILGTTQDIARKNVARFNFSPNDFELALIPDRHVPSGAVRIQGGRTRMYVTDVGVDLRLWLQGRGGNLDALLTDANGDILSDADGNVLYQG